MNARNIYFPSIRIQDNKFEIYILVAATMQMNQLPMQNRLTYANLLIFLLWIVNEWRFECSGRTWCLQQCERFTLTVDARVK